MNHAMMRLLLRDAFARVIGREGTIPELQCLQAIAALESAYGTGWKPPGVASNNYGAIQAGSSWSGATFQYTDTRPNSDGSSTPYVTKFRKYPTPIDGAVDLVKVVYLNRGRDKLVLIPAGKGLTHEFSRGLHLSGYYEGFGRTRDDRINNHHRAVVASIRAQALTLSEDLPADIAEIQLLPPLLRRGARGPAVESLQRELNRHGATPPLIVDGEFGGVTGKAVREFQRRNGLVADELVGARTWDALVARTQPAPGGAA